MATWFAQTTGNINAANMWNSVPAGGGTVLTWPPASGDVLVVNGKAGVTINVSTNLGSTGEIRNDAFGGAIAGGYFTLGGAVTLTANITASIINSCLQAFGVINASIVGNIDKSNNYFTSPISLSHSSGTVSVTGNIKTSGLGILNGGAGSVSVTGSVECSGGAGTYACRNSAGGAFSITGNATCSGSGTAVAIRNNGAGTFNVAGYVQAGSNAYAVLNDAQGVVTVGETRSASNGRNAVIGAFRYASATAAKSLPIINGSQRILSVLDVAALVPAVEYVRAGVKYGDGAYTGTLALQRKRQTMAGRF